MKCQVISTASNLLLVAIIFYTFSAVPWYGTISGNSSYVIDINLNNYNNTNGYYYILFRKNSFYIEQGVREDTYEKVIECSYESVIENNNVCGNLTINNSKSIKQLVNATTSLSLFNAILPLVVLVLQVGISIYSINKNSGFLFKYIRVLYLIVNITSIIYAILVYGVLENSMDSIKGTQFKCDIYSCISQYSALFFSFIGLPFLLASIIIVIIGSRKANQYEIIL